MKSLVVIMMIALGTAAHAADKKTEAAKAPDVTSPGTSEMKVSVKGMVCAFCAQGIEKNFKAQKEVENVQVSLENKTVKLKFREGQKLSNEKVAEILKDAGYETDFAK